MTGAASAANYWSSSLLRKPRPAGIAGGRSHCARSAVTSITGTGKHAGGELPGAARQVRRLQGTHLASLPGLVELLTAITFLFCHHSGISDQPCRVAVRAGADRAAHRHDRDRLRSSVAPGQPDPAADVAGAVAGRRRLFHRSALQRNRCRAGLPVCSGRFTTCSDC